MNRDRKADVAFRSCVNVVAARDTQQSPTRPFDRFGKLLSGNGLHTAISRTRPFFDFLDFFDFPCDFDSGSAFTVSGDAGAVGGGGAVVVESL